jgi:predicted NBD/HSP70 family sugar kinase
LTGAGSLRHCRGMPQPGAPPGDELPLGALLKSDRAVAFRLLRRGPASQADLVARSGLSRPTVLGALTNLSRVGLAEVVPDRLLRPAAEGRRSQLYRLTLQAGAAIGVEIGRRHITIVGRDAGHQKVLQTEERVEADADDNPLTVLKQTVSLVRRAADEIRACTGILGVAVGIPAPVTRMGRVGSRTLPAWADVDPAGELSRQLAPLPVYVGNEAQFGALGEYVFGPGDGKRDMTYVKLGTGIGAGIIVDGHLHRGASGTAGELGHITVDYRGRRCPCGNVGCLERYAGGRALLASAREDGLDIEDLPSLVSRARAGDTACERIISEAATMIGTAIGTLVTLNGPEVIVLGGSLSAAGELLARPLRAALDHAAFTPAAQAVTIKFASLGRWASATGAAAFVFERFASPQR